MRERLRQAEDRLRLARRVDRGDERLCGCDPPRPSAARAPPAPRLRCARALRRAARAAPRARRAGSSSRSPPPGARGGIGSCPSPARRRGRRARPPGAATPARRARGAPPDARSSGYPTSRPAAAASRNRLCVGRSSRATRCSSRSRRPRGSSSLWPLGRGQELLGEEGVAFGAVDDRIASAPQASGASACAPRAARTAPRARAARARAGAPSPSAGRRRQVGACAPPTRARPRGRSRAGEPAGRRGCARGRRRGRASTCRPSAGPRARAARVPRPRRSVSRASVSSNTRSCEPAVRPSTGRSSASGRRASTNGWYGSSVPTRSIERPSRTSNPASRARVASSDASRVLPMPASPATRTVVPLPDRASSSARPSSSSSGTRPTNVALARASIRPVSRRSTRRESARTDPAIERYGRPAAKDKALRPMRSRASAAHDRLDDDEHEEARDDSGGGARGRAAPDWLDEDAHGERRRRPAPPRARVGQRGGAADPVHPRLVAEPSLLGEAVRERAGRRVPAGGLRPPRSRHVRGTARRRALHGRHALGGRRGGDHRRAASRPAGARRAGPTAPSSSATTCAPTGRIESPRSTSSKASPGSARRRSARSSAPAFSTISSMRRPTTCRRTSAPCAPS